MATDFARLDALYPLPAEELSRQWLLTRDAGLVPPGWSCREQAGWHLAAHPDAHVCALAAADGQPLGWALEPLAHLRGDADGSAEGMIALPVAADGDAAAIEAALYGRDAEGWTNGDGLEGGNWVAIILGRQVQRVYQGATHSIVYSPDRAAVATSHNPIPGLRRDEALSRAYDPLATNGYFTFGLTAFQGLHRLLPNHCLDLARFEAVRHWPVAGFEPRIAAEAAARRIVDHARRVLRAASTSYTDWSLPLSAGRDSRAVLACLRPFVEAGHPPIRGFTSSRRELAFRIDAQIATRLARIAGLPHEIRWFEPEETERAALERAFVRLGESKSGPILAAPAKESGPPPPPEKLALPGMAGEAARAFYWEQGLPDGPLTAEELARRTDSPATAPVIAAARAWLDGLPEAVRRSPADTLDLAYVEQRMGCWDASSRYLFPGPRRANLSVMGTTLAIETMMRLPLADRRAQRLQSDMIAYGWPELLPLPFNTAVGALRLHSLARRGRRSLGGRLRRLLGR